jgi:hypothetical protein
MLNVQVNARVQQFESFYGGKYQGRRLVWAHSLERCVVRDAEPYDLSSLQWK